MISVEARQVKKIKVSDARAQLGLSHKKLAERAGLVPMVIFHAERGHTIRRLSAYAILNVLNEERAKRNLAPFEFEQMDWKVQGDGGD